MLEYLLKSSACMAAFLLFYQFLLEKESMHHFKRFFLLGALVTSLTIPVLVFTEYVETTPQNIVRTTTVYDAQEAPVVTEAVTDLDVINWSLLLWTIYGVGLLAFAFRFGRHLYQILHRIQKNPKLKASFITRVLLKEKMPPHTFFRYIFLNKDQLDKKAIPNEVLLHEETHAKQWHSLDVLFIELLQVILWFNPLLLLFKKNIKLNHEFLADSAVLKENVPTKNYQNTLLSFLSTTSEKKYQSIKMANAINYSSIKKRFTVMKKRTSPRTRFLKTLLLLPLFAILLSAFCEKRIVQKHHSAFSIEGAWLYKDTEDYGLSIVNQNNELYLFSWDMSFPIVKQGDRYYAASEYYDIPISLDEKSGILSFGSKEYVRESNSSRNKFEGTWVDTEGEIHVKIENFTDSFIWTLTKDGTSNKFYPKKSKNGYQLSYGHNIWSFQIEDGILIDSNGKSYIKSDVKASKNLVTQTSGKGLDTKELETYGRLAERYKKNYSGASRILAEDLNQMHRLQAKMSSEQRANSKAQYGFPNTADPDKRKKMPEKIVKVYNDLAKKYNAQPIEKRVVALNELQILEGIYGRMTNEQKENAEVLPKFLPNNIQKGASREQMSEYNALAKKYNTMPRNDMHIQMKEVERMKYIYSIMSDKQREDAEPFPDFPEPPPPPEPAVVEAFKTVVAKPPKASEANPVKSIPPPPGSAQVEEFNTVVSGSVPPPNSPIAKIGAIPPPPPTPISPLDHIIDMAQKGATFFFEGKKITGDQVIELFKTNKNLNIETTGANSSSPRVKISQEPITIK